MTVDFDGSIRIVPRLDMRGAAVTDVLITYKGRHFYSRLNHFVWDTVTDRYYLQLAFLLRAKKDGYL